MSELDSKGLGRLQYVADPRTIWQSESEHFTPWLAENLDVLGDALGMTLSPIATEVNVGQFRLDIKAEDEDGRVVIIENQLEKTDHFHLGQCLVYAAGLEAATVVWIARHFRDDFRRAFDWLNERTDQGVQFFGVELGVVQIGASGPRAPVFEVVSRPNEWAKGVKESGSNSAAESESPLNAARQDLFGEVLEAVNSERPAIRVPARNRNNSWLAFASGPFGSWSISQVNDGRIRVEAYLDCGDQGRNKELFDGLESSHQQWALDAGVTLHFERLDNRRASRIAAYHEPAVDLLSISSEAREALRAWAVATVLSMHAALDAEMRTRAKAIKNHASALGAVEADEVTVEGSGLSI